MLFCSSLNGIKLMLKKGWLSLVSISVNVEIRESVRLSNIGGEGWIKNPSSPSLWMYRL